MSNINLKEHYRTFKWAVSKKWKDKNGLYESIQYKMKVLKDQYGLSERDVVDDLFANYWERDHYLKYDETRGSLNNWIARYVNLYLNHVIRRHSVRAKDTQNQRIDPVDQRNCSNIDSIDIDNEKEDPDYQPEIVFDTTNPENLLIAKETLQFVYDHFSKIEIAYLMGEIDLQQSAELSGISCEAFRKRLDRRRVDFRNCMQLIDQCGV
jgi:DNA-directed RNA polymerase specialized sigma24 family protein